MLPISVVNSFSFRNRSVRIVLSTRIEISSHFPLEFDGFIQFNRQKTTYLSFEKCYSKHITIFCALQSCIFFYCVYHSLCDIDKTRAKHPFWNLAPSLSREIIIAIKGEIHDQSEVAHLFNHWSNYTIKLYLMYVHLRRHIIIFIRRCSPRICPQKICPWCSKTLFCSFLVMVKFIY